MNITPVLGVPSIHINNNDRKQPTKWAEQAVDEIMTKVILSAPLPDDPIQRELALSNKAKFMQRVFDVLHPIFQSCITSEQLAAEQPRKGSLAP